MSKAANQKPAGLFLLEGISCLVFNKDFTQCALSKKDNVIYIYQVVDFMKPDTWKLLHQLKAHVQYVSGLDWCANSNELLSVSYDKTAYVWTFSSGKWSSENVVATPKLGYLSCKWNDRGDKFCAGTSSKNLFIGYYNGSSNWWMGVNIKAHKSSVCTCEIDPSSLYVISGSTDLRVCISSCYLPQVDDNKISADVKASTPKFGEILYEFRAGSWITSVCWNKSGNLGFAACQNATIAIVDYKKKSSEIIKLTHSPITNVIQNGEDSFYGVSYDRNIYDYQCSGGKWNLKTLITDESGAGKAKGGAKAGGVSEAVKKFQNVNLQKKESLAVTTKQNMHLHKSLISSLAIKGKTIITTDVTGFVKYWNI